MRRRVALKLVKAGMNTREVDLWVFNRNELRTKELAGGDQSQGLTLRLEAKRSSADTPVIPRNPNQRNCVRLPQLARDTQPTDARSACRASGLLEIALC